MTMIIYRDWRFLGIGALIFLNLFSAHATKRTLEEDPSSTLGQANALLTTNAKIDTLDLPEEGEKLPPSPLPYEIWAKIFSHYELDLISLINFSFASKGCQGLASQTPFFLTPLINPFAYQILEGDNVCKQEFTVGNSVYFQGDETATEYLGSLTPFENANHLRALKFYKSLEESSLELKEERIFNAANMKKWFHIIRLFPKRFLSCYFNPEIILYNGSLNLSGKEIIDFVDQFPEACPSLVLMGWPLAEGFPGLCFSQLFQKGKLKSLKTLTLIPLKTWISSADVDESSEDSRSELDKGDNFGDAHFASLFDQQEEENSPSKEVHIHSVEEFMNIISNLSIEHLSILGGGDYYYYYTLLRSLAPHLVSLRFYDGVPSLENVAQFLPFLTKLTSLTLLNPGDQDLNTEQKNKEFDASTLFQSSSQLTHLSLGAPIGPSLLKLGISALKNLSFLGLHWEGFEEGEDPINKAQIVKDFMGRLPSSLEKMHLYVPEGATLFESFPTTLRELSLFYENSLEDISSEDVSEQEDIQRLNVTMKEGQWVFEPSSENSTADADINPTSKKDEPEEANDKLQRQDENSAGSDGVSGESSESEDSSDLSDEMFLPFLEVRIPWFSNLPKSLTTLNLTNISILPPKARVSSCFISAPQEDDLSTRAILSQYRHFLPPALQTLTITAPLEGEESDEESDALEFEIVEDDEEDEDKVEKSSKE